MRFSLAHMLQWAGVPGNSRADAPFSTVSMSSRPDGWPPMRPGGLFVAIRGERRDGHDFVADAFENGAIAALVDHVPEKFARDVEDGRVRVIDLALRLAEPLSDAGGTERILVVVDPSIGTLATLQRLGQWWRQRWGRPVVAIAGSVGKTTTKDLVTAILSQQFQTHGTAGNLNNELGLPMTLLGLEFDHEVAAVEIGISAPGEMATFAAIASPDVAVMTRIEVEHLEFLRDIDTVAREEGELVATLPTSGTAVLNADDPRVLAMASRTSARVVTYGVENPGAQIRAEDVRSLGLDGLAFRLCHEGRSANVRVPLVGRHFVSAALAGAAAGFAMGCSWEAILAGLALTPKTPRIRVLRPIDDLLVIDDTYNASPASCIAALELLSETPGTRIAVLGDMLELGDFSPEAHAIVGARVPRHADALIAVGAESRAIVDAATAHGMDPLSVMWVREASDAYDAYETWRRASGVVGRASVLVKGSRGMHMEIVTRDLERLARESRVASTSRSAPPVPLPPVVAGVQSTGERS
jgi:UDP-N-acetylmuramoyl-tripeptide--D-alanyl-D-alanine ligase